MKIPKNDALLWFEYLSDMPEDEPLTALHQEIIYATFAQIEAVIDQRNQALMADIPGLKALDGRTYYVGEDAHFPNGCRSCLMGSGLSAVRRTNKCNLVCKFCYNYGELDDIPPVGEGLWEIGGTKFYEKDIDLLLSIQDKPTGIAYVFLEPFMEIEKYYPVIRKFHDAGIHQHLYTNGTLATEASLKALGEAGLDELRFNLGASHCADKVIHNMALAKQYIGKVGIETPMTPDFLQAFQQKKNAILATGIDFINCAELHLNTNNIYNYYGEPMYIARQGYISPTWSRKITFRLMKMAVDEQWDMVVHDCSNDTKFARALNLGRSEGQHFGAGNYGCEFDQIPYDVFLPILSDDEFQFLEEDALPKAYQPPMLDIL